MERLTGRILDFGSGLGEYDDFLGADSVDDDTEKEYAEEHLAKITPTAKHFQQWVTVNKPLPVPDNYYHVIRMGYCWGWMGEDFVKTGPELVRILVPGGMLVIFDAAIDEEDHGFGSLEHLEEHFQEALPNCTVFVQGRQTAEGLEFNVIAHKL